MNQYQKTTEKKKQAIIQAALRLFKDKGFKETSIKSIAEAAEVSPVSIYNYFGSKDNLVALCVNDLFEEITQQAEDILKSNLAFNTKLDQALELCQEKMSQLLHAHPHGIYHKLHASGSVRNPGHLLLQTIRNSHCVRK